MQFNIKNPANLIPFLLFSLFSCSNSEKNKPNVEVKEDTVLKDDLAKLKKSKNYKLDIDFNLKTSLNPEFYKESYVYLGDTLQYTLIDSDKKETTIGFTNDEDGIYSYSIQNGEVIPNATLSYDTKDIFDSSTGLKNFYNNINLKTITYKDLTYTFASNDLININAFLTASSLTPTTGLSGLIEEYKVTDDNGTLIFNMDFGVNGYITHTISKIDDTSLTLPEIAKYKKDGGKAKAADQNLVKLVKNLETYNYSSDLGEFVDNGKTCSKGRKYFTQDYIYDDYSDEYLAYYKSTYNKELTRNGYLTFKKNKGSIQAGVYSFSPKYDESNKPYLDSSCLNRVSETTVLTDLYPYFSHLSFYKYISSFDRVGSTSKNYFQTARTDLAYDFGKNILGVSNAKPLALGILDTSTSFDDIAFDFYVTYSSDTTYIVNVSKFNQTKIDFIESYSK